MKTSHEQYADTFSKGWADGLNGLPEHMQAGMVNYVLYGRCGDFLTAVVSNDLMGALRKADDTNRNRLWDYGNFLHNFAPPDCFGSPEIVKNWKYAGGSWLSETEMEGRGKS